MNTVVVEVGRRGGTELRLLRRMGKGKKDMDNGNETDLRRKWDMQQRPLALAPAPLPQSNGGERNVLCLRQASTSPTTSDEFMDAALIDISHVQIRYTPEA